MGALRRGEDPNPVEGIVGLTSIMLRDCVSSGRSSLAMLGDRGNSVIFVGAKLHLTELLKPRIDIRGVYGTWNVPRSIEVPGTAPEKFESVVQNCPILTGTRLPDSPLQSAVAHAPAHLGNMKRGG